MKYVIKKDTPHVIVEKAWPRGGWKRRGLIPKKVQVQPVAGKPYLAIRWTGRARSEQLGGDIGHQLKQLVRELPTKTDWNYLEKYIRYKYGQWKSKPAYPKEFRGQHDHIALLKQYEKKVDNIMRNAPRWAPQGAAKPAVSEPPVRDKTEQIGHPRGGSIEMADYLKKWVVGKIDTTWDAAMARAKLKFPGQSEGRYERALVRAGWIKPVPPKTEIKTGDVPVADMADYLKGKFKQEKYRKWDEAMKRIKEVFPGQDDAKYERALTDVGLTKPVSRHTLSPAQKTAILSLPHGYHQKYFIDGKVSWVKPLGGGCNTTYTMKIEGDGQGCWKPVDGERKGLRGEIKGDYYKREAAVYSVAKSIGLDDLVPETYIRDDPEQGIGSLQAWVWNGKAGALDDNQYPEDVMRSGFLDFMTENSDRHGANYFVTTGGKIQLIDNGLTFSDKHKYTGGGNDRFVIESAHMKVPDELLQKTIATVDEVAGNLEKLGLEKKAIEFYRDKVTMIRNIPIPCTVHDLVEKWRNS